MRPTMSLVLWFAILCVVPCSRGADWKSLFDGKSIDGWEATGFAGHGDIEVRDGAIVLNQGILTGIHRKNAPANIDYEVELEAKRALGGDFFCGLTFPFRDTFASLIVGGWGGAVVGISSLDGQDASENETTKYVRFQNERWYRIRLAVTSTNISAWIDDDRLVNVDPRGKKIALRSGDIELSKPFGIASWATTAELRGIRWRSLAPAPVPALAIGTNGAAILPERFAVAADRIVAAALPSDAAWRRLAELCDRFGPRFSGTTNLESAIDWILAEMRADGFDNVRGEPIAVPRWVRGEGSVQLVGPTVDNLPMLALGGSVATPAGGITALALIVTNYADLTAHAADAVGRIVVYDVPFTKYGDSVNYRWAGATAAARVGAVAGLVRSIGDFGLRTPHTGAMKYDDGVPRIPFAAISDEDAQRLHRWQDRGSNVVLSVNLTSRTEPDAMSRNVVAELRGSEWPEEVVVVGGHVDSWDVGRGALDDGGGCIAAWEALRLLKQLGLRPRRTIRVVLWTNEENGGRGAKGYREAHGAELDRHVLAIESDSGAFDPEGFGFTGSDGGMALMRGIGSLLAGRVGAGKTTLGGQDADNGALLEAGVPVAALRTSAGKYFWFHHTDADTPERVDPKSLARCSAALAVLVYTVADLDERLPR